MTAARTRRECRRERLSRCHGLWTVALVVQLPPAFRNFLRIRAQRELDIEPNAIVVASLINPREKVWGQLVSLRPEGVTVRGIQIEAFDDFIRQITNRTGAEVTLTIAFYPMHRVERIASDEDSSDIPSLSDRFREKAGITIQDYLEIDHNSA